MHVKNDWVDQLDKSSLAAIKGKIAHSMIEIKKMFTKSKKSHVVEKSETEM